MTISSLQNSILHAIDKHDRLLLVELVNCYRKLDTNLDFHKNNGRTPLMHAALAGNSVAVEILLVKGADIACTDVLGNTAAHFAAYTTNGKVLTVLAQHGADFGMPNHHGETPLLAARRDRKRCLLKQLKTQDTIATAYSKEFLRRKRLAHILELSGITALAHPSRTKIHQIIHALEGWYPQDFWHTITKRTEQFFTQYPPNLLPPGINPTELVAILKKTATGEESMPLILHTGFKNHYSTYLMWGKFAILCDRGGKSHTPFYVHQLDKAKITPWLFTAVTSLATQSAAAYQSFFSNQIQSVLADKPHQIIQQLNHHMKLPMQHTGNCSWANIEAAFYALCVLQSVRHYAKMPKEQQVPVEQLCRRQKQFFDDWKAFIAHHEVKKYLDHHLGPKPRNKPYYPAERRFLDKMRPKLPQTLINNVDKLIERVDY